nr:hypothetical protein [Tanacetum cinerariifolium]
MWKTKCILKRRNRSKALLLAEGLATLSGISEAALTNDGPAVLTVDSMLPTTFWAEAVNTVAICHVTILNTKDNLGKFEGKADEVVGWNKEQLIADAKDSAEDTRKKTPELDAGEALDN